MSDSVVGESAHPRRPNGGTAARALLAGFGALLGLVCVEVAVRLWYSPDGPGRYYDTSAFVDAPRWVPHPFLPYAGPPGASFEARDEDGVTSQVVTNAFGFRAHEFPVGRGGRDFFVLCFGESSTFGYRTSSNAATWPERLEARLRNRYPERNVRVFNLGVDMATSAFSVVNMALVGMHLRPDLIVVYHGCNDAMVLDVHNYRWDHAHAYRDLEMTPFGGIQAHLPAWARRSQALFVLSGTLDRRLGIHDLYRAATHPLQSDDGTMAARDALFANYRSLAALAHGAGADILFSTFQFRDGKNRRWRRFNASLRREFARNGWWFVDQDALIPDGDAGLQVDACHFTQEGRDLLAANFFDAIVGRGLLADR